MTSDLDLMRDRIATLYVVDDRGRIGRVNETDGDRAPRLFLGRTAEGGVWRFRDDLAVDLVDELDRALRRLPVAVDLDNPLAGLDEVFDLLRAREPIGDVWSGPAWRFPPLGEPPAGTRSIKTAERHLLDRHFPTLGTYVAECLPCVAVVVGGDAVAVCFSSRNGPLLAEAGVATVEEFRGRGFAGAVVAGWAAAVRAGGRESLYSTSFENLASQRVAAKLGLVLYGVDLGVT